MRLITRTKRPPGGWIFEQASTNWRTQAATAERLIDQIVAHRKANGLTPTSRKAIWIELEEYTCNRLRGRKVLWSFCQTRFSIPGKFPAPAPSPVTTTTANAPTQKAPCKTCGGRKKIRQGN